MEIVAIARLAGSPEDEARALGAELGTLPYEQRLKLNAGAPAVVLKTPDAARAAALAASLAARGHEVVRCRAEDVVGCDQMIELRVFRVDRDALVAQVAGAEQRLAWSEIAALVRATHRTSTETRTTTTERRLAPVKGLATMGLSASKKVTQDRTSHATHLEAVLYVFPRTAGAPWILREGRARYDQLGVPASAHSASNFALAIDQLRTRATAAVFDDRLVARKGPPADVDVLAHLLAMSLGAAPSPFR